MTQESQHGRDLEVHLRKEGPWTPGNTDTGRAAQSGAHSLERVEHGMGEYRV